jgi:hypothetical protein
MSQTQPRAAASANANANATAREAVIEGYTKALKPPAFAASYQALVRQANDGGWDYEDFLTELYWTPSCVPGRSARRKGA